MIALFTDFGWNGPYVGQMKSALYKTSPDIPVVDLIHDAPAFNPRSASYLLAAVINCFQKNTVFLCVVDPGVGSDERKPVVIKADDYWFVGPENGLFNLVARRAKQLEYWDITWQPENLSNTFHGRDLFAPVAALLAKGKMYNLGQVCNPETRLSVDWEDDLAEIIYIDHYGNCMTGLRASCISSKEKVHVANRLLEHNTTFANIPIGEVFWYENSSGLVELSMNQGSIAKSLSLAVGNKVSIVT